MVFQTWSEGDAGLMAADGDLVEARRQIGACRLVGVEQEQVRRRLLDFVGEHRSCLYRTCLAGHLTGSGVVVDPGTNRTLLIHHAKLGRWLQPGGHADGDGNLGAVAWREATEETGLQDLVLVTPAIDVDMHTIPARSGEPEHVHLDIRYLILAGNGLEPDPNHETLGARWMGPDDAAIDPATELHRVVIRAVAMAARIAVNDRGP